MSLKWSLLLEFKQGIRTKKFWAILVLMTVMYVPILYGLKRNLAYHPTRTLQYAMTQLVSFVGGMGMFFVSILAILIGAVAINSEINKGTLRIAISKPIKRWEYILGKILAHSAIIVIALGVSGVVVLIGMKYLGFSVTREFLRDVFSMNGIILLAMIQLLALGYLLSTFIRSEGASMGAAIAILFIIFMIVPAVVHFYAYDKARHMYFTNSTAVNREYEKLMGEYTTRYLFFDPLSQTSALLSDVSEKGYTMVERLKYYRYNYSLPQGVIASVPIPHGKPWMVRTIIKNVSSCPFDERYSATSTYENGTLFYVVNFTTCHKTYIYRGVPHSVSRHLKNLWILIGMMAVYLGIAFYRFLRMDLR
ncbi:MAG: ABC transporter permease [Thermococci archaeon]|nr:ABC transporter permease [Thermococci archaeon]